MVIVDRKGSMSCETKDRRLWALRNGDSGLRNVCDVKIVGDARSNNDARKVVDIKKW
jgi:hypothetical protein